MKKNFLISTVILLLGGLITKILGMVIKIVMTRSIGIEGVSLYMLVLPTLMLFINLGQMGLPIALSRLVALNNRNNKLLYLSVLPVTVLINCILSFFIIISAKYISVHLLHNHDIILGIVAIGLVIPFTSISSICRSYFFGKERMGPHVISNIAENIIRLVFMLIILPKILFLKMKYIVFWLVISNIVSEIFSTLILLFFIPRKVSISFGDFKPKLSYLYDSFRLGLPNVGSNLISSISYFLEPIILTNVLLHFNYSSNYIVREYGIITGYVTPLLLLPSFFTLAISQAIMPYVTREFRCCRYNNIKKRIHLISMFIILFGLVTTLIFELYGDVLLKLIYNTSLGYNYLRIMTPFFILQYCQSIYIYSLNGMGMVHDIFILSLINALVRLGAILFLSIFKIGIYAYLIALIINIIICYFYLYWRFYKYLQ